MGVGRSRLGVAVGNSGRPGFREKVFLEGVVVVEEKEIGVDIGW